MIEIGSRVCVSTKGICDVLDIKKNAFVGADKNKEYYVLKPVNVANDMVVYLPTDTKLNIRNLISKKQATNILENFQALEDLKIASDSDTYSEYNAIIQSGKAEEIARLLRMLISRKNKMNRKQYPYQEQRFLNLAMNSLTGELAIVLNKDKQDIENQFMNAV